MKLITIAIASVIAISFLALSGNVFFSNQENLVQFGFSMQKIWNIVVFNFVHTGYSHLIANLAMIIGAGLALEAIVKKESYLAIFFGGAAIAAFLTVLIHPEYIIVGSSAGAVALLTASLAVNPKTAVKNIAVLFIIGNLIILGANSFIENQNQNISTEIQQLEQKKIIAQQSGNTEQVIITQQKIVEKTVEKEKIEKGIQTGKTPINFEVHFFAALFAALYIFFFERSAFRKTVHNELAFLHKAIPKF